MSIEQTISRPSDFDFEIGSWHVQHRRLKERLTGCTEWVVFEGTSVTQKILGGYGNIEDNYLDIPGGAYHAIALRTFDTLNKEWRIWWIDARNSGDLGTPVIGKFSNGIGLFYADEILNGKPIKVRFSWSVPQTDRPHWEQAFSADAGETWETNWEMNFTRRKE